MVEDGNGEVEVPATLKALLAARLDQLDPRERRVLERGAVEGEVFHRGGIQALTPEEPEVTPRLAALVRRQLIRSERAQFVGEDGFRSRHLLIVMQRTTRSQRPVERSCTCGSLNGWSNGTSWWSSTRFAATTTNRQFATNKSLVNRTRLW